VRAVALAAEAALALEHELAREERKVEVEIARGDLRLVALPLQLEPPVVDPDAGAVELGVREREAGAGGALVVREPAALRIGERRVREEDLSGVEFARIVAGLFRPRAEECDLESNRPARCPYPAGDVPPLDAELGMCAVIAREGELAVGRDGWILDLARKRGQR
jgi:hypothetical protein